MTQITIASGTKVLRDDSKLVTLAGTVFVDAERQADGGYIYSCAGRKYYTSAAFVTVAPEAHNYAYRHKDGLVWMV